MASKMKANGTKNGKPAPATGGAAKADVKARHAAIQDGIYIPMPWTKCQHPTAGPKRASRETGSAFPNS